METRLFILYFFVVRIQGAYEFPSKYNKSGSKLFQFVWEQWQDIISLGYISREMNSKLFEWYDWSSSFHKCLGKSSIILT